MGGESSAATAPLEAPRPAVPASRSALDPVPRATRPLLRMSNPVPSALPLALALTLALAGGQTPGQAPARDVELPRGFWLELASGRVSNQPPGENAALLYRAGRLEGVAELRRLPPEGTEPRTRVELGSGGEPPGPEPRVGEEFGYDLGPAGWGYLRVLALGPERVRLEHAHSGPAVRSLGRDPARLSVRAAESGLELSWTEVAGGASTYRVERRTLPRGPEEADLGWEHLADVRGHSWLDEGAGPGRIQEYRVRGLEPAAALGARARGARDLLGAEGAVPVRRGMDLCLLTGREGTGRSDVRIQHANESLVQLQPGPGVRLRNLSPAEEEAWSLPGVEASDWSSSALFAGPGRGLAAHLPEGVYVRLRVEVGPGGEPRLQRQIDLQGGRLFPPPPPRARASWDPRRGLLLALEEAPQAPDPGLPAPELLVEVEEDFESGTWRALETRPAARELVLGPVLAPGLVRLRLRYRLPGGEHSLAGPPMGVLAGDDGGEGAEGLLGRALGELADPDYGRRRRAQGILEALGERSAPRLREALGSEDPELAAAARELLERITGEAQPGGPGGPQDQAAIAPLLLRAQAEARGLVGEPPEGWFDPRPARRALAVLRNLGAGAGGGPSPWRDFLAGADPDPGVRRLASLAPTLRPLPGGPPWVARLIAAAPEPGDEVARLDPRGVPTPESEAAALLAGFDASEPWQALARLAAVQDLGLAAGGPGEPLALGRARLVRGLLARHVEDPQPAFLEAARLLVEDPLPRLAALRELADRHCAPPAGEREELVLGAASGEALAAALEEFVREAPAAVDLVLPAGVYEATAPGIMLRVGARGLRLVARGEVVLRMPLYVTPGAEVVLEGLRLAPPSGIVLHLGRSAVTLIDCTIVPTQVGVQISDGLLVAWRSEFVNPGGGPTTAGIRAGGESLVLLRDSLIDAGGTAVSGARLALIERSVLLAPAGVALQASKDGEGWVLDSYLSGSNGAVSGLSGGLLEGGLLASEGKVASSLGLRVWACPEHLLLLGSPGELEERPAAQRCPLGR